MKCNFVTRQVEFPKTVKPSLNRFQAEQNGFLRLARPSEGLLIVLNSEGGRDLICCAFGKIFCWEEDTFKTDKGSADALFSNRFRKKTEPLRGLSRIAFSSIKSGPEFSCLKSANHSKSFLDLEMKCVSKMSVN
ncbi:hypothetical protein AVEN_51010-1 [Araneus ventricosus]|uniref:Uncharacterized protein n=1 Tax=Araneus ventricosus TaxID=182803 RepID=A0A4Y2ALQ7_ARAVE|nr:hypothetical protein AVEN_51010-1 [Araneus ventricosus]